MSLKITDVRAITTAPEGINLVTVKIETSEPGLYGVGCATFTQRYLAVVTAITEYLKPFLVGKDPSRIEDIWQTSMVSGYWRNGPVLNNAISGVDMALWDIKGKLANMPLYDLFGGKCREAAVAYTHAEGDTIEEMIEKVYYYKELGYRNIRCQVGGYGGKNKQLHIPEGSLDGAYYDPQKYMKTIIQAFDKLCVTFEDDINFCHDVHERLSPIDAVRFAKEMEQYKLFFLEDLVAPENIGWLSTIRQHTTTPIAIGELFNNSNEWKMAVQNRLIDFIRIHISQIGGVTPARKLIALCDNFGIRTAWHGPGDLTPIGHAVNAHLDLSSPNFGVQEWCSDFSEKLSSVFPGMPTVRDGYIYLNAKPGIGVDIDEKEAAKYPCQNILPKWTLSRLPDGSSAKP